MNEEYINLYKLKKAEMIMNNNGIDTVKIKLKIKEKQDNIKKLNRKKDGNN